MKGFRFKKIIAMITALTITLSLIPTKSHASVSSDRYASGVSIGFASMGNINSLSFTLTDNYILVKQNIICKKNLNYRIDFSGSFFRIYEDGNLIGQSNSDIIIQPLNTGSYIMFTKEGYSRKFPGSIMLKRIDDNKFFIINSLNVEDYLKGVLPFELGNDFPMDALKAQAVAARTYCIANKGKYSTSGYDLTDDTSCQVYRGVVPYAENCNEAVEETAGEVLTFDGSPINAYFSSSNGGYTERNDYVWNGEKLPYLNETQDTFDTHEQNWTKTLSSDDLDSLLKSKYPDLKANKFLSVDISGIKKYPSGRVSEISITYLDSSNSQETFILTKDKTRSFFGLKSSLYNVTLSKDTSTNKDIYSFIGSGYGHGIGMSQWGAYERANNGQDYKTILNFYYAGSQIESMPQINYIAKLSGRIGGKDRYETSVMIAEKAFEGSISNIVIASGSNFPDALSGSVLAKKMNCPLLIVNNTPEISSEALNYINEHLTKDGHIYLLGGSGVLSDKYIEYFASSGYTSSNIERIGGKDRIDTSLKIASHINADSNSPVVICTANNFPDSLSISPVAASNGWPILLVSGNGISSEVQEYLAGRNPQSVYIIGGTGAVTAAVEKQIRSLPGYMSKVARIGGTNRYETSCMINNTFMDKPNDVFVASGDNFPDALSGSIYAASVNGPMLLVDGTNFNQAKGYLSAIASANESNVKVTVFGLEGAVSTATVNNLIIAK